MIKRAPLLVLALFLMATAAPAEVWNIDKPHSSVSFSVRHLVISRTTGDFNEFNGAVDFDGKNIATGLVEITVQMASVDTDDDERDTHLRSADFLDVERYPSMSFLSTKIVPGESGYFELIGDLTIKGVSVEVVFDAEFNGVVEDPWGNTRAGFSAETVINRHDFGIAWSKTLDGGGLVVGDDVVIVIELEVIKAK